MMKIKKLLTVLVALTFILGLATAIPTSATPKGNSINLELTLRFGDNAGLDFKLDKLLATVENADQGFYAFGYVIDPVVSPSGFGPAVKILTQAGEESAEIKYKRFSNREEITELTYKISHWEGGTGDNDNSPDSGFIPAEYLVGAAAQGMMFRCCTQSDTRDFTIKNIVVLHIVDDVATVIYDMQKDATLMVLADMGTRFDNEHDLLVLSGSPQILALWQDEEPMEIDFGVEIANNAYDGGEYVPYVPSEEPEESEEETGTDESTETESAAESTTSADAPASTDNGGGGNSNTMIIIIAIIAVVVVGAVLVVMVVKKKK